MVTSSICVTTAASKPSEQTPLPTCGLPVHQPKTKPPPQLLPLLLPQRHLLPKQPNHRNPRRTRSSSKKHVRPAKSTMPMCSTSTGRPWISAARTAWAATSPRWPAPAASAILPSDRVPTPSLSWRLAARWSNSATIAVPRITRRSWSSVPFARRMWRPTRTASWRPSVAAGSSRTSAVRTVSSSTRSRTRIRETTWRSSAPVRSPDRAHVPPAGSPPVPSVARCPPSNTRSTMTGRWTACVVMPVSLPSATPRSWPWTCVITVACTAW